MTEEVYAVGTSPPIGEVPPSMHAMTIRQSRFGPPNNAFADEIVPVPEIGPGEVLVWVMAAGVNYNNVWAALGEPLDVVNLHKKQNDPGDNEGFHIGGSDASGVVWAVGEGVTDVKVGDHVVAHCGMWDVNDPAILNGGDPVVSRSFKIWGYETNWGSFAQFTKVQAHQCLPMPPHLTWEKAASYTLVGATTYRMLLGYPEHAVGNDDPVLVWGGSGGLGSMAIQIVSVAGGIPIAVVSNDERGEYCMSLGAKGFINRNDFGHWGALPDIDDKEAFSKWVREATDFRAKFSEILGERRGPRIVFEHPGEDTMPTSVFVCDPGGMVVICAGTSGYNLTLDDRHLWMRTKRLQGSHFADDEQASAFNDMVWTGKVDPCLSLSFPFHQVGKAHQLMHENGHPNGNMVVRVSAQENQIGLPDNSHLRH